MLPLHDRTIMDMDTDTYTVELSDTISASKKSIRKADKIYNQEGRRVSVATQAKQEQREGTRAIIGWQKSVE